MIAKFVSLVPASRLPVNQFMPWSSPCPLKALLALRMPLETEIMASYTMFPGSLLHRLQSESRRTLHGRHGTGQIHLICEHQ